MMAKKLTELLDKDTLKLVKETLPDIDSLLVLDPDECVELTTLLGEPVDGRFDVVGYTTNLELERKSNRDKDINRCLSDLCKNEGITNTNVFEKFARDVLVYEDGTITNTEDVVAHVKDIIPEIFNVAKVEEPKVEEPKVEEPKGDKPPAVNPKEGTPSSNTNVYRSLEEELLAKVTGLKQ